MPVSIPYRHTKNLFSGGDIYLSDSGFQSPIGTQKTFLKGGKNYGRSRFQSPIGTQKTGVFYVEIFIGIMFQSPIGTQKTIKQMIEPIKDEKSFNPL